MRARRGEVTEVESTNKVVTPNYNHSRDLPRRLDSIVAQTYQDFELSILDEASTDNSREVIESHAKDPGEGDLQCGEQRRHLQAVELGAQPRPV